MKYGWTKLCIVLNVANEYEIIIGNIQHELIRDINMTSPKMGKTNRYEKQSYCIQCRRWGEKTLFCPECNMRVRNNNRLHSADRAKHRY